MSRTYYDILQVSHNATDSEIKEAYRVLAWQSQSEGGQDRLKEINAAYAVLSSPQRREEYDRTLTADDATQLAPAANVQKAPDVDREEMAQAPGAPDTGPGFHPLMLLFSVSALISYWFSKIRYFTIPFNLLMGVVAAGFLVANIVNFAAAPTTQMPALSSIEQVVKGQAKGYVRVAGTRSLEPMYYQLGNSKRIYYAVYSGPYILVANGKLPESGTFVGMLRPMDPGLRRLIGEDAVGYASEGVHVGTEVYLAGGDTPLPPKVYLWAIALLMVAVLVLLVPPLYGYMLFRPETASSDAPSIAGPAWPVRVLACGRFVAKESGKEVTEVFIPASLERTGSPDHPLEAGFGRESGSGKGVHVLAIPAGSTVQWGYAYGVGDPLPAVAFQHDGRRSLLTVPSEQDAWQIAALFESGRLNR